MSVLVSVITVNLNNAAGLEQTINSVIAQSYQHLQYIVIDGDSIDDSKAVIANYAANINIAISEKDNGVYSAMNKGIKFAKGEYLLFLNSGDTFIDKLALQNLITKGDNADIIYGNLQMSEKESSRQVIFPDKLSFKFFYINSLPHCCSLIRRKLFDSVGLYREDFRIVSDWIFFTLAICRHNATYKHVNETLSNFMLGGLSSTQLQKVEQERQVVFNEYFPAFVSDYKELYNIEDELWAARKQLGYRVHRKIRKLFFR